MLFLISLISKPQLYLDPSSGSLIVQIILAALFSIGLTIKLFWSRIRGWFGGKPPTAGEDREDDLDA